MMFVLIAGPLDPSFYIDRDFWTIFGAIVTGFAALIGFLQKFVFYEVEEKIIFKLRIHMFSELIYK